MVENLTMNLKIKDLGLSEFSRVEGQVARAFLEQLWGQYPVIEIDFQDVEYISVSFIDEFIAKLFINHKPDEVLSKIKLVNLDNYHREQIRSLSSARIRQKKQNQNEHPHQ